MWLLSKLISQEAKPLKNGAVKRNDVISLLENMFALYMYDYNLAYVIKVLSSPF